MLRVLCTFFFLLLLLLLLLPNHLHFRNEKGELPTLITMRTWQRFVHRDCSLFGALRLASTKLDPHHHRGTAVSQDQTAKMGRALFSAYVQEHNNTINRYGEESYFHQVQRQQQQPEHSMRSNEKQKGASKDHSRRTEIVPHTSAPPATRRSWKERRGILLKHRDAAASQQAIDQLRTSIQDMRRCLKHAPEPDAFDYELKYQEMLLKLQGALSPLTKHHFSVATVHQLLLLLRGVTACGSFRLGFVASSSLYEICHHRLSSMSGSEIIGALNVVLTLGEDQGVPAEQRRTFATLLGDELMSPAHRAEWFRDIHPHSVTKLIYSLIPSGRIQQQAERGLPPAQQLLPDTFGYRVLREVLSHALVATSGGGAEGGNAEAPAVLHSSLELSHIVCFVCAVAHYRVPSEIAMQMLVVAAPLLKDGVMELKAYQLSRILMAYARVGYKHPEWFTTVGQRAGDLGEQMSQDDAAQILNAFAIVGIEHTTLRRSLESSMRLKSLRRSALFNKMF
jgi:hypothetical protein